MSHSSEDLVFLIMQLLENEKYKETVHKLEEESGLFFNMKYLEKEVLNGNWDEVERYLSGFTKIDDNHYSRRMFLQIRRQKYLEALDKHNRFEAVNILEKDLMVFNPYYEAFFKELTMLLALENFRKYKLFSRYGDTQSERKSRLAQLKNLIETNPLFRDKLQFPSLEKARLRTLNNQSLNWQHQQCENQRLNPVIKTLYADHSCGEPIGISDEVSRPVNISVAYPGQSHRQPFDTCDDLPKTVACTLKLSQGSDPMSMDFHPVQHTLLLVGTNVGDVGLWEVGSGERIFLKSFNVCHHEARPIPFLAALAQDPSVSVTCVKWSPDGSLFGVAYSRNIVHLYSYHGSDNVWLCLEIHAHFGSVNDLAFSHPNGKICVITCGDDKSIKVWDAATGAKQYTFEGHEVPVYSVCPRSKENVQFILSSAMDGKIKGWFYDSSESRIDYDAYGHYCTIMRTMACSADGLRLFSCGISKDWGSCIVEWNETEWTVKRIYQGFRKLSLDVVQFDTTKNRFLAAGDEFSIKFWDMNNINLLTTTNADGGLPESPCIRFNKEGTLLAVSTDENGIKILANADGLHLLRIFKIVKARRVVSENISKAIADATTSGLHGRVLVVPTAGVDEGTRNLEDVKPILTEDDKSKIWKLTEINEPAQCRSLRLPSDGLRTNKISRLIYTNSGDSILVLASNAIHLLWKWSHNNSNLSGKATTSVPPLLWKPQSGKLVTNDITDTNQEEVVPCFALSRNDCFVVSASGGKISLFNMTKFETLLTFMPPPPATTFLAFYPKDNNIVAICMDDSTILLYNVREHEAKRELKGHSKKITCLTFSQRLNVLLSSGADDQICVWNSERWEKQNSRFLQLPAGKTPAAVSVSNTRVQFHEDQIHFLVVHETQLPIYETTKLECVKQWVPYQSSAPISHATFSCDSRLVYASFLDATICIFSTVNLGLRCRINPTAYLPVSSTVYPLEIAAHPSERNQFALGLTDGGVIVFEPLESEGKWGVPPPFENQSSSSIPTAPTPKEFQIQISRRV